MSSERRPVTLRTQRLLLRQFEPRDLEPFYVLNSHTEVTEFLGGPLSKLESAELAATITERIATQGWGFWALELLGGEDEAGTFVGFAGLNRPRFETRPRRIEGRLEVGWRLARQYWGRGYATEAAAAALDFAFTCLGESEVLSFTTVGNWRSRRVMERLGMHHDPQHDFDHPNLDEADPLRRHVLYRVSTEQWNLRRLGRS